MKLRVGFIGAGAMAEALIKGLIKAGASPTQLLASDVLPSRLALLHSQYGIKVANSNVEVLCQSDIVILAVKPQNISSVLQEIAGCAMNGGQMPLLVSIAAGITLAYIEQLLPLPYPLVRAMPNTPSIVGAGATAISAGKHAKPEHLRQARSVFEAVGIVVSIPETQIDAVTGLSGSGPAYGYLIIEALIDAGVKVGLPRGIAKELAVQTLFGAAKMVAETEQHPAVLKDQVTSPGGTTIAGVHILEQGGIRGLIMDAVIGATERARQLKQ